MFVKLIRIVLPLAVLSACVWGAVWLVRNPPKPMTMDVKPVLIQVKGSVLKKTSFPVVVHSQGMAQPQTQSTLVPEVSGKVVSVSPQFDEGGFFKKGELLIELDKVDYETALVVAKSAEAQARTALAEETARAEQAAEDWKALGGTVAASELTLRKPQLAQARAVLEARTSEVVKAQRDVERTSIRAPYDGQVLEQAVNVGQFVNTGSILGRVFSTDHFEVRLPLPERDIRFLQLPEHYEDASVVASPVKVHLRATVAGRSVRWDAQITRVESAIDGATRQLVAVAQVDEPYANKGDGVPPLKIGQFVQADIVGETLEDIFIIPRSVVRAGNEIILITKQNTLHRLQIQPLTGDEKQVIVSASQTRGPREGDWLCLTPIPFPAEGAKVDPVIQDAPAQTPGLPSVVDQQPRSSGPSS
jgi:membrane fusion protein, multidrug efflux system